ncbi:MAG: hypothetical protein ACREMP_09755 [Candidatus Tyrphobacter sp.]
MVMRRTQSRRGIVRAIADVMLDGALPAGEPARAAALEDAADGFVLAVEALPLRTQREVRQLFTLLEFAPTRRLVAGLPPWERATRSDVAAFLRRWRFSSFALLRSGYDALHALVLAGWYGRSEAWPHIGYPGPPNVA